MDDRRRVLLESMIASRMGAPGGVGLQDLLLQMAGTDPALGLLAQLISQQVADGGEEHTPDEDLAGHDSNGRGHSSTGSRERARQLNQWIDAMQDELEELRRRNRELARALGACADCWGRDPLCETCGGDGLPGSSRPARELYLRFVAPAVRAQKGEASAGDSAMLRADPHRVR